MRWRVEDALPFAVCLSNETAQAGLVRNVSVVRGNVAPADHGRTVRRDGLTIEPGTGRWPLATLRLPDAGLTRHSGPFDPALSADGRPVTARHALDAPPRAAAPAIHLRAILTSAARRFWTPVPHLGDSGAYDRHFVAETDGDGSTTLRFGDDIHGRAPLNVESVTAFYRIGSGRRGNLSVLLSIIINATTASPFANHALGFCLCLRVKPISAVFQASCRHSYIFVTY